MDVIEVELDQIVAIFCSQYDRQAIIEHAEFVFREKSNGFGSSMFSALPYGLAGFVIRRLLPEGTPVESVDAVIESLMQRYSFPHDWFPPRILAREAIAHAVRERCLVKMINQELGSNVSDALVAAANNLSKPEDAFLLSDAEVDEILHVGHDG